MKQRYLIFTVLLALLLSACLPLVSAFPVYASENGSDSTGDKDTESAVTFREDTVLFAEKDTYSGASSGSANKWNRTYPAGYGGREDPLVPGNTVGFCRTSQGTSAVKNSMVKNYLDAEKDWLIAFDLLLPGATQQEIAIPPDTFSCTLFGSEQFSMTREGESYSVALPGGASATCRSGEWMRIVLVYTAAAKTTRVVILASMNDSQGNALSCLQENGVANGASEAALMKLFYTVPAQTGETALTCGFFVDDTLFCQPGDMYLNDAALEKYPNDPCNNLKRDGVFVLSFSHDIDPASLQLAQVRLKDEAGETVSVTSVGCTALYPNQIRLDFSEDPLPKFSSFTVTFPSSIKDFVGNTYLGETTVSFETYGDYGEKREKAPLYVAPDTGYIMPDAYNTGYRCEASELVPLLTKYPELPTSGDTTVLINDDAVRRYGSEFSGFTFEGYIRVMATKPVVLTDFYLNGGSYHYGIQHEGSGRLTIAYMEGEGSLSAFINGANYSLSYAYIHDVGGDHLKAGSNQLIEHCYLTDGGSANPDAHADVIQFSGSETAVGNNVVIVGNRFDIPPLLYDHVANATIFFKTERNTLGYTNVQISGNWFNGGGLCVYLTADLSGEDTYRYVTFTDNTIGYGCRWGAVTFGGNYMTGPEDIIANGGDYSGNGNSAMLAAGSVLWRDGAGKRVYDVSEVTDGKLTVSVNFANYVLSARNYRLEAQIYSSDGRLLMTKAVDGEVARYIHYNEYATEDNIYQYTDANGKTASRLINLPDLPQNVLCDITFENLPADLTGCTVEFVAYDTTDEARTLLRSACLTDRVSENALDALTVFHTVRVLGFGDTLMDVLYVADGGNVSLPAPGEITGYQFVSWSGKTEGITEDGTVRAIYAESGETLVTITFDSAGGTAVAPLNGVAGSPLVLPAGPVRDGYTFLGWYLGDTRFDATIFPEESITLTAHYQETPPTATVTVTFDSAGGTAVAPLNGVAGSPLVLPAGPVRDGYTFLGWYLGDTRFDATIFPEESITLTAHYQETPPTATVTVTFDSAGGTAVAPLNGVAGSPLVLPAGPVRDGYTFLGWYLGDTRFDATIFPEESITLTAHFAPDLSLFDSVRQALKAATTPAAQFTALSEADRVLAHWGGDLTLLSEDDRNLYESVLSLYLTTRSASLTALSAAEKHAQSWLNLDLGEPSPVAALPIGSDKRRNSR